MRSRRRSSRSLTPAQEFVAREFPKLGLYPHRCSPDLFAQRIEELRRAERCRIALRPHSTFDEGVFGMVCKEPGTENYSVLYFPHRNPLIVIRTQYHELMHIYRRHPLTEIVLPSHIALPYGLSHGYVVTDPHDSEAEQLGAAATLYTLGDDDSEAAVDEEDSPLGRFYGGPFRRFLGRKEWL